MSLLRRTQSHKQTTNHYEERAARHSGIEKEIDHLKKIVSLSGRCRRRHCLRLRPRLHRHRRRCHHFISWAANDTAGAARSVVRAEPGEWRGGGSERRPGGGVDRTEPRKIFLLHFELKFVENPRHSFLDKPVNS